MRGIAASILDGLMLGSGDAVIGINPATDSLDKYLELTRFLDAAARAARHPGQTCVLAHVTTALAAIERGAPVDLVFQSIAGTEAANRDFGVDLALLREAREAALSLGRGTVGDNVMYFETGQGSALSAEAHHGVDQQTLEARAYAVARAFAPLLVNTVVGFIGPEYLYDGKEIIRAGLEDHFCGKLLGLPMGCRCLLHQPRRGRPGRHGRAADVARRRRRAPTSWACPAPTTSCSAIRAARSTTRSICAACSASARRRNSRPGSNGSGIADAHGRLPGQRASGQALPPPRPCRGAADEGG